MALCPIEAGRPIRARSWRMEPMIAKCCAGVPHGGNS
jgi:hypothetical protein